ncbi:MAG TPA: trans-2-enoyl-CoA reductase family protein [Candidatus Gallacutalibacter stercoravium]|nr:trans-2-enoyl-CoA reductase family protein [Candidatus Gallacutalibacter stercoravium]
MIVTPKTRGFICTTAHPVGCRENVRRQAEYAKEHCAAHGPKRVLVLGASTGYGLSSRIAAAFGWGASTLGVIFDKPASGSRTASAGWYNTAAFEDYAAQAGLYAKTINGDAFSTQVKEEAIALIRRDLGQVDLVIYSLAAPRRTTADGTTYSSVLKTVGEPYTNKTVDLKTGRVEEVTVTPATQEEIDATVKVMGGEDWLDWMHALQRGGVLAPGAQTVAYSYIGPELTHAIYKDGSIGMAKQHLHRTARRIGEELPGIQGFISVNKALVTQSSAAIPVVPLYISLLYRVMKQKGLHEGCIEQMCRLFGEKLYGENGAVTDEEGFVRLDDWEMRADVQQEVAALWEQIDSDNVKHLADVDGYWQDFYQMFGFHLAGVDYEQDVDIVVDIPSLVCPQQ